jgi:Spy/CpxP family protein refolding chaperone
MKRILLSTSLALVLSGTLAFAQSTTTTPPPSEKHYRHQSQDPQQQAAWLSKKLNLSSDQTAKLEPILADRSQKIAALRGNTALSHEEWKQQVRTIHESTKQQLATVLTPDQLQQMKAMHHHRHGAPGQGQPQGQPQVAPPAGL